MPRHFPSVNDDLLLVEIIRRLRGEPVPNIDYVAYKGVQFAKFLSAAKALISDNVLRVRLQALVDDGTLSCTGMVTHYFSPMSWTEKGRVTWWHPECRLDSRQWFTRLGTPSKPLDLAKVRDKRIPCTRVGYRFLYVTEDGLPASVSALSKNDAVFSRQVHANLVES